MLQIIHHLCPELSQQEGPETSWTKRVKRMFTETVNTWVDAVNGRQAGTFKKSFTVRFIDVGYEAYELQTKEDPKEVAESFATTERYGSQIEAAKTDGEVQAIIDSFAREETAKAEKSSRIPACQKANLIIKLLG